jgi:putative Mg2+ transporter-C (MgtC) family protein
MDPLRDALFDVPSAGQLARIGARLLVALVLGGMLGYERERAGKAAGLRTHILVALGSSLFVLGSLEAGMSLADLSRVTQGIVAGIGFLGAGAILKRADRDEVQGLTTAANIWFTAAVGTAVGSGHLWLPIIGTVLALLVLVMLGRMESRLESAARKSGPG